MMMLRCSSTVNLCHLVIILSISISSIFGLDPYKTLGVNRNANEKTVKTAYRKLSRKWHPDKNPNNAEAHRQFVEITSSYEILSKPEFKDIYDREGEEALNRYRARGSESAGDPFDVFRNFFGGGGSGRQRDGKRKGQTMVSEMEVELDDIYIGRSIDFEINRLVVCPTCSGTGARKATDVKECSACHGHGIQVVRHQLGPGIFQQMQMQCDKCGGKGKMITHKCSQCHGSKTVQQVNSLTVDLDRGIPDGHEELFEGEGNESPDLEAADVVLRIRIQKQSGGGFKRVDENLYWKETISLDEALLGFKRKIKHLDGHHISISRQAVTQPGSIQVIEDEGMPRYQAMGYGNLYIEYTVVLPLEISGPFRTALESLPSRKRLESESSSHQEF